MPLPDSPVRAPIDLASDADGVRELMGGASCKAGAFLRKRLGTVGWASPYAGASAAMIDHIWDFRIHGFVAFDA
jgi:hypothetical protein